MEARSVVLADVATFSILRAANGGPSGLAKELFWTPSAFLRSAPAFMSLLLLLACVAIQFTSALLLSAFHPTSVISDSITRQTPVLQTLHTRHLLDRATTQTTDDEVAASLTEAGLQKVNIDIYRVESGKALVARRGAMNRYGQYPHDG